MGTSHSYISDPAKCAGPVGAEKWVEYDYVIVGGGNWLLFISSYGL